MKGLKESVDETTLPSFPLADTSTLPMVSYDTPFPANGSTPGTHTYETPLNRPTRPFVTISCDDIVNGGDSRVIANHTRSGSNTEASLYEEPLVSVPQYDSILGAQVRRGRKGEEQEGRGDSVRKGWGGGGGGGDLQCVHIGRV